MNSETAALLTRTASLLLGNGQTTEGTRLSVERLALARGCTVGFSVRWGEFALEARDRTAFGEVAPLAVDIRRVMATEAVIDTASADGFVADEALARLELIVRSAPSALSRFVLMAAAGAAALGIIFGAHDWLTAGVIAASAGSGALLRRLVSRASSNPFLQPFAAALLAGAIGGLAVQCGLAVSDRLIIVCPCMVLVPGPHFLNGGLDLVRARMSIGAGRVAFALMIVSAICCGLFIGLAITGTAFPQASDPARVPLGYDVFAAGVAVAAYGTFFNMPWRLTAIPTAVGMAAHAFRWHLLKHGASLEVGLFGATLLAGTALAPLSRIFRLPFGASAFSSVVSLIPGLLMFDAASAVLATIDQGNGADPAVLLSALRDAVTALVLILVMTAGLVIPKVFFDDVWAHCLRKKGKS